MEKAQYLFWITKYICKMLWTSLVKIPAVTRTIFRSLSIAFYYHTSAYKQLCRLWQCYSMSLCPSITHWWQCYSMSLCPSITHWCCVKKGSTGHQPINTIFRAAICYICFPGPTRVLNANGISSLQPLLHGSLGDILTDRPCYSVGSNRRSAQWTTQILLLSMATTSIYWSSRLKYTIPVFPS